MRNPSGFRKSFPRLLILILSALVTVCGGCTRSLLQMPANVLTSRLPDVLKRNSDTKSDVPVAFDTRMDTPLLGDYISVQGNTLVPLRGIGLVVRLDGTGGDPPPSSLRTQLQQDMARRKVSKPNSLLASRNTALVVVTAYLPPMVRKGESFDARIVLPPNSNASSLKGGYLLPTRLSEEVDIRGVGTKRGHEFSVAQGPILTALGVDNSDGSALLTRGSIPGGATSKTDRDLEIVLRKRFQSIRKSRQIANAVSERFHHYDRFGRRESLAEAKTHAMIKLKAHPTYSNNFPRYHRVIRSIALAENSVARRLRTERLGEDLLNPNTAETSAIHLEAIGDNAVPFLKVGLQSPHQDVCFFAAEALAYLGDSSGVDVLTAAARDQPAFRVYAFAALSVVTDADAVIALRGLTGADTLETQYGAVRALTISDVSDRTLNTIRFPKQFLMHQVAASETPGVHVTRRRTPEITVFGTDQELQLPAVLNAGNKIRVIGLDGESTVSVIRYELNADPIRKPCNRRLTDIIRTAGELGATYPDIVQMLVEAERQHNLAGRFGIDQLPQSGRRFVPKGTAVSDGDRQSGRKVGSEAMIPGLFDRVEEPSTAEDDDVSKLEQMLTTNDGNDTTPGDHETDGIEAESSTYETDTDTFDLHDTADSDSESWDSPFVRSWKRIFVEPFRG